MKAILDKVLSLYISKKLTVFLIATILVVTTKISGIEWVNIAIVYIGTQGVIDAIVKLRKK
jgi:hypothetical protein